ncbi:GTP pyrophosphokinase [Georgenia sp. Z1491]|uniref:GTP pyrophosphokinase n=1 Tax=Georgenia sp. Z1491 TaxID=3416707 RepID=UPI003CED8AC7
MSSEPAPTLGPTGGPGAAAARMRSLVAARRGAQLAQGADTEELAAQLREALDGFAALRMHYQAGIEEVRTKVDILRQEFEQIHDYSPIEHVRTRLKSSESLLDKALRTCDELSLPAIRRQILDIAGIRITCSFVSDVYWIAQMLERQPDLEVLQVKDYIARPKANGYRSLHLIVQVPVFLSTHTEHVPVELQIRTIAMDFWASVEHKLKYKYDADLPAHLAGELDEAARLATELDERMGHLREEIRPMPERAGDAHPRGGSGPDLGPVPEH